MTREEFDKLWGALASFWPKEKLTKQRKGAWMLALEPFQYDGVRENILAYARSGKGNYFPDVADMTRGLVEEKPDETACMDTFIDTHYAPNPVTAYAAQHHCTISKAEERMGTTWDAEQEAHSDL